MKLENFVEIVIFFFSKNLYFLSLFVSDLFLSDFWCLSCYSKPQIENIFSIVTEFHKKMVIRG